MSQKFKIHSVKVEGSVYLGQRSVEGSADRSDYWSRSSTEVMDWLCDGWRFRFNQFRACSMDSEKWTGTDAWARKEYPHLSAMPSMVLQSASRLEAEEWRAAWKRIKTLRSKGGRSGKLPRFKSLKRSGRSFVCWSNGGSNGVFRKLSRRRGEIVISGRNPSGMYGEEPKLGWSVRIRFRMSQEVRPYTSVRVNWTNRSLVLVNAPAPVDRSMTGSVAGIDVGVTHTLTDSNGNHYDIPRATVTEGQRYKKLQRKLARQDRVNEARGGKAAKFGSNRRSRTIGEMNRLSSKMSRRRSDWVEKITTDMVVNHDVIALEDLSAKKMSRRGAGKKELNRGILDSCWGMFQSRISYKAELAGVKILWVDPSYTSQTCNQCGHLARENRESQAVFKCIECGHTANADINAATNILDRGLSKYIGPGLGLGRGADIRPIMGLGSDEAERSADSGSDCEASTPEGLRYTS